jgi:hypothetical protein
MPKSSRVECSGENVLLSMAIPPIPIRYVILIVTLLLLQSTGLDGRIIGPA